MLMAWCFSTRTSVATVLTTHPCVFRCLGVNSLWAGDTIWLNTSWSPLVQVMAVDQITTNLHMPLQVSLCKISVNYFIRISTTRNICRICILMGKWSVKWAYNRMEIWLMLQCKFVQDQLYLSSVSFEVEIRIHKDWCSVTLYLFDHQHELDALIFIPVTSHQCHNVSNHQHLNCFLAPLLT